MTRTAHVTVERWIVFCASCRRLVGVENEAEQDIEKRQEGCKKGRGARAPRRGGEGDGSSSEHVSKHVTRGGFHRHRR